MKDQAFVDGMKKAGRLAAMVLEHTCSFAKDGVTTNELDKIAHDFTLKHGGTNACLGYKGYPKSICTSVNEMLCHGVPNDVRLKERDVINIDVTVKVGPYHGDTSRTFSIGTPSYENYQLILAAEGARNAGIRAIRPYGKTGDIGFAIQAYMAKNFPQFTICKDIGGHGIGKIFHDAPWIPPTGQFGHGEVIKPWTCITVEPIIMMNVPDYQQHPIAPLDGYDKCEVTEIKGTGGLAAQFEHTILVTDKGYEILTVTK